MGLSQEIARLPNRSIHYLITFYVLGNAAMLFRDRSTPNENFAAATTSLLARLVGHALPRTSRRLPTFNKPQLKFQTLEPRLVMSGSVELNGGLHTDDDTTGHSEGCGCGCCAGGHLHGLDAIETTTVPDESGGDEQFPLASLPLLSSNPTASVKLYLDFDGHFESQWGAYSNITTPAFSIDGNYASFSTAEMDAITEIWQRVSEDYAPFNIDVTTVNPGSFANGEAMRVVIGGNSSWYGGTVGGLGYINSFTDSVVNTVYVFPDHLAKNARYIGEAASHEAGHGFGLRHQSRYVDGSKTHEYNPGGNGWAPIMGSSYYQTRSTWSDGTTYSSNAYQDDMEVIARAANGFGYRTDDHGGLDSATTLSFTGNNASASGIVEKMSDQDAFSFTAVAGQLTLQLNVAEVGANLDSVLELRTQAGELIATADPSNNFGATISTTVDGGNYVLIVRSTGEYGSVGQYTISATRAELTTEIAVSGDSSVAEDETFSLQLDEVVEGASPIQSWTINWGDGMIQVVAGNPNSVTHTYTDGPGEFTIQVTATDGEETFEADNHVVNVFDPVPVLATSGPTYVVEGNAFQLGLSAGGDGAASITHWTINWGDGTVQVVSGNPNSISHVYTDGTTVVTIQATAANSFGTYAAASKNITVQNAAATLEISGSSTTQGGSTYTLGLLSTDSGDDTISHWTINWGDGTIEQINGDPSTATHSYANSDGQFTISATATDEDGTYTANNLIVDVVEETNPPLNFSSFSVNSYSQGQDKAGSATVYDGGLTLQLTGNVWKRINYDYTITVDTVLELEFSSIKAAELSAIGFDTDLHHDQHRAFQLAGTDSWGLQDFRVPNTNDSEMVRIVIPIGQFYTGDVRYLFFINDEDVSNPNSVSTFANVRVYEFMTAHDDVFAADEANGSVTLDVLANDSTTTGVSAPLEIIAVSQGSAGGTIVIANGGTNLIYTPAAGFYGSETFTYTMTDGMQNSESTGRVTVAVEAATSLSGESDASAGENYVLRLNSRDGLTISNWTVDWGDGTVQNIAGNPTYVTHIYQNSGRQHTITATAANGGSQYGSLSYGVVVDVPEVNFEVRPIRTYAGKQDAQGDASVEHDGNSVRLDGNVWKRISMPLTITSETVLEFDLRILREGEIHGIGFDNDRYHSVARTFQVRGSDTWGRQDFRTSSNTNGTVHYVIPVGEFYRGYVKYLFFVNDEDVSRPRSEVVFSNIRVYEHGPAPQQPAEGAAPAAVPNLVAAEPIDRPPSGLAAVLAEVDKQLLMVENNAQPTAVDFRHAVQAAKPMNPQSFSTLESWPVSHRTLGDSLVSTSVSDELASNELFFALYEGLLD